VRSGLLGLAKKGDRIEVTNQEVTSEQGRAKNGNA